MKEEKTRESFMLNGNVIEEVQSFEFIWSIIINNRNDCPGRSGKDWQWLEM